MTPILAVRWECVAELVYLLRKHTVQIDAILGLSKRQVCGGKTVYALVIDDSRAMRMIVGKFLREVGFEVIEASNGREALEVLNGAEVRVELALVDWNMPEMNGYEFVVEVRKRPTLDDLRLMMVTTETERENVAKAIEAGADEYLMKPFTQETIIGKLRSLGMKGLDD
jgi:two-component system chemotaxis response regulator CheY